MSLQLAGLKYCRALMALILYGSCVWVEKIVQVFVFIAFIFPKWTVETQKGYNSECTCC